MIEMDEHRDLLKRSRAHRSSRLDENDFRAFTSEQETLGGLR